MRLPSSPCDSRLTCFRELLSHLGLQPPRSPEACVPDARMKARPGRKVAAEVMQRHATEPSRAQAPGAAGHRGACWLPKGAARTPGRPSDPGPRCLAAKSTATLRTLPTLTLPLTPVQACQRPLQKNSLDSSRRAATRVSSPDPSRLPVAPRPRFHENIHSTDKRMEGRTGNYFRKKERS